jgi:serine/threonine protein kinase
VDDFKTVGVGTPHYQSPEIISNESYTFKTDVW